MNEAARAQYLDAMGIEQFVPRYSLPHSAGSVLCKPSIEWLDDTLFDASDLGLGQHHNTPPATHTYDGNAYAPLEEGEPKAAANQAQGSVNADPFGPKSQSTQGMQAFLTSEPMTEPLRKVDTDLTLQQWVAKKPHKVLRFHLLVWVLDNGVMLVDTHLPKAALPTPALLKNIVYALDAHLTIPAPGTIRWPVLESTIPNPQEEFEAASMVQAFVLSRIESMSQTVASKMTAPAVIVAMGEVAARMLTSHLLPSGEDSDASSAQQAPSALPKMGESILSNQYGCPVVALPSLADLLKNPLLKQAIWPALKPYFK